MIAQETGWKWGIAVLAVSLAVGWVTPDALAFKDLKATRVDRGPKIDGAVDKVWRKSRAQKVVVQGGAIGKVTVSLKVLYDNDYIYLNYYRKFWIEVMKKAA